MAETQDQITPVPVNPEQNPGFDVRHQKELGVKKFAGDTAFNNLVPLGGAAAGAGLGLAIAKPVSKILPKKTLNSIRATEALGEGAWSTLTNVLSTGADAISGNTERAIERLVSIFGTTPKNAQEVVKIFQGSATKDEKLFQIAQTLKPDKIKELPNIIKGGSAVALGFTGLVAGSVAIGYREWRKKESARLAAQEINQDIANMELFKPSAPELVEENKRLRTMVAALPTIEPATAESQGRVENRQTQATVS